MLSSRRIAEEFGDILPSPLSTRVSSTKMSAVASSTSSETDVFRQRLYDACTAAYFKQHKNTDFAEETFEHQLNYICRKYGTSHPKRTLKSVSLVDVIKDEVKSSVITKLEIKFNTLERVNISMEDFGPSRFPDLDVLEYSESDDDLRIGGVFGSESDSDGEY
jgi:hypothetical protein